MKSEEEYRKRFFPAENLTSKCCENGNFSEEHECAKQPSKPYSIDKLGVISIRPGYSFKIDQDENGVRVTVLGAGGGVTGKDELLARIAELEKILDENNFGHLI